MVPFALPFSARWLFLLPMILLLLFNAYAAGFLAGASATTDDHDLGTIADTHTRFNAIDDDVTAELRAEGWLEASMAAFAAPVVDWSIDAATLGYWDGYRNPDFAPHFGWLVPTVDLLVIAGYLYVLYRGVRRVFYPPTNA